MTLPPEELLNAMGRVVVPADGEERATERRSRIVSHLERFDLALAEREAKRRRRLRFAGIGLAFACGVLFTLGLPALKRNASTTPDLRLELESGQLETGPQRSQRGDGSFAVSPGQRVRTHSGTNARLRVDGKASVQIESGSEVSFAGQAGSRVVELHRGSVRLAVGTLAENHTLSVRTGDATVTVHGTLFSVTTSHAAGRQCSSVILEQGIVSVDSSGRHLLLTGPTRWSSCPENAVLAAAVPPSSPEVTVPRDRDAPVPETAAEQLTTVKGRAEAPKLTRSDPPASGPPLGTEPSLHPREQPQPLSASTLGEETALLAAARKASLSGSYATAVSDLERLLELYPTSILAQNARVEHFRALKHLGRGAEARRAALKYLGDYPSGFARDEARALALSGK
jgi:hypothetical protein